MLVRLLAVGAILGGGATLAWYNRLSKEQKLAADQTASDCARQVFGKTMEELTQDQAGHVADLTREHLAK